MKGYKELYTKTIAPALMKEMGLKNRFEVPRIVKVVINVGVGKFVKEKQYIDQVEKNIERITGQKPVKTIAKKSISNFKIREGNVIGIMVTMRGMKMYNFIEKLIRVTLPRVRDFRGVSKKGFDSKGNYTFGFKEHMAFPEIKSDEVDTIHGLQITVHTTAKNKEQGLKLLQAFGVPFEK